MQINYTKSAFSSLLELVNFIESKNTAGAGSRWLYKFEAFLMETSKIAMLVPLCNNQTFRELTLRCVRFNDWIIAFTLEDNNILIEAILHKSRLSD
jgi:hypothetical protein